MASEPLPTYKLRLQWATGNPAKDKIILTVESEGIRLEIAAPEIRSVTRAPGDQRERERRRVQEALAIIASALERPPE